MEEINALYTRFDKFFFYLTNYVNPFQCINVIKDSKQLVVNLNKEGLRSTMASHANRHRQNFDQNIKCEYLDSKKFILSKGNFSIIEKISDCNKASYWKTLIFKQN
jgi:hypothetical protein